jgi:hypothetical protein
VVALVGRDRPAAVLRAEIDRTLESHGGLVLVTGEAGIGKTVLVADAAEQARRHGALVATGTCWDREDAPGYWPWVQVVRGLQRASGPVEWAEARATAGGELALLLGEASAGRRPGAAGDGGFGLLDAVTTLLVTVSRGRPLVVVLDDLHWADAPSIRLLEFVVRHAWFERLLLVGCYRDVEVEAPGHPLGSLLAPLIARATTVPLTGLERDDVGVLMARTAGREPPDGMVAEVHRRTGGNPFFVDQTAHLWHTTGSLQVITPGVRDAIQRRLGLLDDALLELLTAAAVLGPEFHRQVLAAAAGVPGDTVDALLGEAVAARLVVPLDGGAWGFVHDLVREALYACLDDAEARQLHAAVVVALERVPALAGHAAPASVAHHAYHAVPEVAPADAAALLEAAGRYAAGRLAFAEAVGHHRRALELVPGDRPRLRAAVALQLGAAQQFAGELAACFQTYSDLAGLARELDDPELLARSALRLRGAVWLADSGEWSQVASELVNEAHAKLLDGPQARGQQADLARERELAARAVELARSSGDDEALWDGILARHDALWGPGTARDRQVLVDELTALAHRTSDRYSELFAAMLRLMTLLELGDPRCLREFGSFVALAERMDSALSRDLGRWAQGTLAALEGRFDDARALIDASHRAHRQRFANQPPDDWTAQRYQQQWTIDLLQGRLGVADEPPRSAADAGHAFYRLLEAIEAVHRGDVDTALAYHSEVAANLSEATMTGAFPLRWVAPLWLRFEAEVAAASRDPELCDDARAKLSPLVDQWAMLFGDTPHGPFVHWLAMLDAAQERWDEAVEGFTAARAAADRIRARPASVRARAQLAEALLGRGAPGDAQAAADLLDEVEQEAVALAMHPVVQRARQARARLAGPAVSRRGTTRSGEHGAANAFRFDGQVWALTFQGQTVHVPDAKGLHDLQVLLGRPGVDVRAVDLLDPLGGDPARATGSDPVLDEQAKAAYRDRLAQLDEQIDQALERRDDRRAAALDRERRALIDELRRATGLGGRSRRLGDASERARKAVSERIRDTLRRLDRRHPSLARHLRASVSTGATCRYQPPIDTSWAL